MLTAELTHLAAEIGLSPRQAAGAVFALTALCVFFVRRAIFRTLAWVIKVLFGVAFLAGIAGGVFLAYQRFGAMVGTGAAAVAVAFIFLAGRMGGGASGSSTGSGWASQDDDDRQRRDDQLREDERVRRVHDEAIRRNPW